jgi:hypothetical protein
MILHFALARKYVFVYADEGGRVAIRVVPSVSTRTGGAPSLDARSMWTKELWKGAVNLSRLSSADLDNVTLQHKRSLRSQAYTCCS